MKIAHVTATFPPYWTGTGTVCYFNARELARLGHEVHVFTAALPGLPAVEACDGFTVHRLRPLLRFGNAPLLPGLLRLRGFDLIHLHHPFIFGAELVSFASRLRNMPVVLTHHNDLIGRGIRGFLFDVYSYLFTRLNFRNAQKTMVVSNDHAQGSRLRRLFNENHSKVVEIPNGVDIQIFRPGLDRMGERRRLDLPDNALVVLFVGALDQAHHYRRVDILMNAIRLLNNSNIHLVLAGDGDQLKNCRQMAMNLGVISRTHFLRAVSHFKLPEIYAASDIVVLPSQIQESFGMVLLEAMACGIPVIASNLPGVRTVVGDGRDGFLVQPANVDELAAKLFDLLNNPLLRLEMGKHGRAKVEEKYAWPKVVNVLEQVYLSLVS